MQVSNRVLHKFRRIIGYLDNILEFRGIFKLFPCLPRFFGGYDNSYVNAIMWTISRILPHSSLTVPNALYLVWNSFSFTISGFSAKLPVFVILTVLLRAHFAQHNYSFRLHIFSHPAVYEPAFTFIQSVICTAEVYTQRAFHSVFRLSCGKLCGKC